MNFTRDDLSKLEYEYNTIAGKYQTRLLEYTNSKYSNISAREYAEHGFMRRLGIMVRCIDNIFSLLPPARTEVPAREDVSDAVINLQSSIFNTFGCTDNLAWLWVYEKDLRLKPVQVGLRKKNKEVHGTFSKQFQDHLISLDSWFNHLEDFRHALAHRIPLYIPPYSVTENNVESYQELENRIQEAIFQMDFDERERLLSEQKALCTFVPIMTHSFGEGARKVVFHAQIIANFNTIYELSGKFLEELGR